MNTSNGFTFKSSIPQPIPSRNCKPFFSSNEPLFSLFQTIILLAFSLPANFNVTKYSNKFLIIIGYSIALIWINYRSNNYWTSDFSSIFNWYTLFLIINGLQLTHMIVQTFFNQIPRHLLDLYSSVFQPLGLAPRDFLDLTKLGTIKDFPVNRRYALEGSTRIGQCISVLLTGRLQVSFGKTFLHDIEPNEFIDSVEFKYQSFYCTRKPSSSPINDYYNYEKSEIKEIHHQNYSDDEEETSFIIPKGNSRYLLPRESNISQVTITTVESSKIITWDITSFLDLLESRDQLKSVVYGYIGKDIIHKLYGQ